MNNNKYNNMITTYTGHQGPETIHHLLTHIQEELVDGLTGKQLGLLLTAVDRAYKAGQASTGADVIDTTIWIDDLHGLYSLADISKLNKQ